MQHQTQANGQGLRPVPSPSRRTIREVRDGRAVVHVPLAGEGFALLDADDADRLAAAGVKLTGAHLVELDHGSQHVALPSQQPDRFPVVLLARLVTGATPGQRVRYLSGNRLDMTRRNLKVEDRRKVPALVTSVGAA
jgi:hypothetical protein